MTLTLSPAPPKIKVTYAFDELVALTTKVTYLICLMFDDKVVTTCIGVCCLNAVHIYDLLKALKTV